MNGFNRMTKFIEVNKIKNITAVLEKLIPALFVGILFLFVSCDDDDEIPGSGLNNRFQDRMVSAHSDFRSNVGITEDLIWSEELVTEAEALVDQITSNCAESAEISTNRGFNQLFTTSTLVPSEVVTIWHNGSQFYNYEENVCQGAPGGCDNYLQVVWADAKELGCATSICSEGTSSVWICLYDQAVVPGERPF